MQPLDLEQANAELEKRTPPDILLWICEKFSPPRVVLQASMQKTSCVLMHMISQICHKIDVLFVDTGAHFPETLALRDEYERLLGLRIVTVAPAQTFEEQYKAYGRHLYLYDDEFDPPGYRECCRLRKEEPFLKAVCGKYDAVVGGLMRAEGGNRENIRIVHFDPRFNGYKVYPLAHWTEPQVDEYLRAHNLPVHPLYARGYASIGCEFCTTPITPGEPRRAGRWRHIREAHPERYGSQGLYCGINREDRAPH